MSCSTAIEYRALAGGDASGRCAGAWRGRLAVPLPEFLTFLADPFKNPDYFHCRHRCGERPCHRSGGESHGGVVMIEKLESERIDEALEYFDEHWSPAVGCQIGEILERYALLEDTEAMSEMIRIDIERRYSSGLSVQLDWYLEAFALLVDEQQRIAEIAFEDYRSRQVHGLPLSASRYRRLPGIESQAWYRDLERLDLERLDLEHPDLEHPDREQSIAEAVTMSWERALGISAVPPSTSHLAEELEAAADGELSGELESHGFTLVKRIGSGTFGKVYLATQADLADRYVVLKVVERTLAEPQKLALLQHTNIVPIYSFHPLGGRSVICMPYAGSVTMGEFLSGHRQPGSRGGASLIDTVHEQLHRTVRQSSGAAELAFSGDGPPQPASPHERPAADEAAVLSLLERLRGFDGRRLAIWMFRRLAAGLAHSHARGVLHGDLKPDNVLIRNDGEPALFDFNLSRPLDRCGDQRMGGTLPYMSPESYRELIGSPSDPSPMSDIYSLGVMLFEYVTGRLPYPAPRSPAPTDLELAIEQRRLGPAWQAGDGVALGLRSVIDKCLAFEPRDRYLSAEDVKQDLACEEEYRSLRHAREPVRARTVKWLHRHPRLSSASSVGVLLLAMLLPTGWWAARWRDQTVALASQAHLSELDQRSNEALAALIVDPMRNAEASIEAALEPLQREGLLDPGAARRFTTARGLGESERQQATELLFRHLGHVAWVEVDRLGAILGDEPAAPESLRRLDQLSEVLEAIVPADSSRAVLRLRSRRAQLAGQEELVPTLAKRAAELPLADDAEMYLEAVRLQTDRAFAEARNLLASLADRETVPTAIRWTMLGRVQLSAGDHEAAKLSFTQSLERAPKASRLWHLRAHCHSQLRQFERAYDDYSEALRIDPTFASAWWGRAQVLIRLDRPEEALDDLNQGLVQRPNDPVLLMVRSNLLRRLGHEQAAEADFAKATQQTGLSPRQRYGRAIIRLEHDPQGALTDLKASVATQRNSPRFHYKLARVLTKLERFEEAIESLEEVERLEPENEKAIIDRAVLLARLDRQQEALEAYERAIEPPTSAAVLYQAACVNALLDDSRRFPAALSQLAKAVRGGYGMQTLATDPDLEPLRHLPGFRALQRTSELAALGQPQLPRIEIDHPETDSDLIDSPFSE